MLDVLAVLFNGVKENTEGDEDRMSRCRERNKRGSEEEKGTKRKKKYSESKNKRLNELKVN